MANKLPVDFEKKVKQPPPADGKGYPYQISAKDLMSNFNYLDGIMPDGNTGDMLYHNGTSWALLANPGFADNANMENLLTHDGVFPFWDMRPTSSEIQPWDVYELTGTGAAVNGVHPNYDCRVWPGSIATMMPSNVLETITVTKDLTYWKAVCTTDGQKITLIEIIANTNPPVGQTPANGSLPTSLTVIFAVTLDGSAYRTIGDGNITATSLLHLVTEKASPPAAGMPTTENWYVWEVGP